DNYPLFGDLELSSSGAVQGRQLAGRPRVWVAQDLLALLPIEVGGALRIGELDVTIAGVLQRDSSQTVRFGGLAPRIYIHKNYLSETKLLTFGSTFTHSYLALFPTTPPAGLKKTLEKQLGDPAINVTTPEDLERGSLSVMT